MSYMRYRKIVRDGAGFGVQELDAYGDLVFLNDEPLPSAHAANKWMRHHDAGKTKNWEALRRNWALGVYDTVEEESE